MSTRIHALPVRHSTAMQVDPPPHDTPSAVDLTMQGNGVTECAALYVIVDELCLRSLARHFRSSASDEATSAVAQAMHPLSGTARPYCASRLPPFDGQQRSKRWWW